MVITNAIGVAFTAIALSALDADVTFVFPEDGATNMLAWTSLSDASRQSVSQAMGFVPVPPSLAATVRMAQREKLRIDGLAADGRIDAATASVLRKRLQETFCKACLRRGLTEAQSFALFDRCVRGSAQTSSTS